MDAPLDDAGRIGERLDGRQVVTKHGYTAGKHLRHDGPAYLHGLIRSRPAIPSEHRGPFLGAALAQENGRAVGRRHFEDRFEHLFFQRFQAAHGVHRFADAEQGIQIAERSGRRT